MKLDLNKFNQKYQDIVNQYGNAYNGSKFLAKAICVESTDKILEHFIFDSNTNKILAEGIMFEPSADRKGGIIVFSTDVNSVSLSENRFINWLKQKVQTLVNRFNAEKTINKIAQSFDLIGWTIGRFLHGNYTGQNGKAFSENSLSVEVVGVKDEILISIAEQLCTEMKQECVLVKSYTSNRVMFVDNK